VAEPACSPVLPAALADTLMVGLSKDDQPAGTSAQAAAAANWNRPIAAKTGTTEDYKSAAFLGATPQLAAAVITFDDSSAPRPICDGTPPTTCPAGNIYGGKTPARTFYQAMTAILAGQPALGLPAPDPRYLTGGRRDPVPPVVGRPVAAATAELAGAGFRSTTTPIDSRAPAGTVIAQDPQGSALAGAPIRLTISSGSVPPPPPPPLPAPG